MGPRDQAQILELTSDRAFWLHLIWGLLASAVNWTTPHSVPSHKFDFGWRQDVPQ